MTEQSGEATAATVPVTREWKIARRTLSLGERTLIMGVLNVTPDSFSDGGQFYTPGQARARAHELIEEGADIIDVGGESTRPGAEPVTAEEELRRIVPVIEDLAKNIEIPISVDTTKREVARAALEAGAEIINDISALRFDFYIADEVAKAGAGLVLMHSRGTPATMHRLPPVPEILEVVTRSLRSSIAMAAQRGVTARQIVLDPGIGFGKSPAQNVELIAGLAEFARRFHEFPILVGTSRKSFIGRILDGAPVEDRIHGTMASVTAAVLNGADIVRVHDVRAARETVRVADAIRRAAH
ncbi:MAG TPA: dihydropteroate synthase [Pyrinomonadaceae bacterium]|jgi:dihydropteroate synthase|nr:dihydropteroate synthase [Pyrinomonadaceae bacterium]